MGIAFGVATGLLLVVVAARLMVAWIDWLDASTSRLTPEQARNRAALALANRWPPTPTTWDAVRPVLAAWVVMAVLLLLRQVL